MISFGIIGAGWRAEFYIRIAAALPDTFTLTGVYIRNPATAESIRQKYNVKIYDDYEAFLASGFQFVVSCVSGKSLCDTILSLAERGIPVLSETPAGVNFEETQRLLECVRPEDKVQVAEQYHLQPQNQAIKAIIDSGMLGTVSQVSICACHDYHAMSLIRFFLGLGHEMPESLAVKRFRAPIQLNEGRQGVFSEAKDGMETRTVALLDFGSKFAVYDFSSEQYFSDIRQNQFIIRGDRGEVVGDVFRYYEDGILHTGQLQRYQCGVNENLGGMCLRNITANGKALYRNPFAPVRMSDEEIAIASCLLRMGRYVAEGIPFYSLPDAVADQQLALKIAETK